MGVKTKNRYLAKRLIMLDMSGQVIQQASLPPFVYSHVSRQLYLKFLALCYSRKLK
jgi:hypothetical protein